MKTLAIEILADRIHAAWTAEYKRQNGATAQRWKPLSDADYDVLSDKAADAVYPLGSDAWFFENVRKVGDKAEINIAGLPNNRLPAKFSEENTASAQGAIEAILANPGKDVDYYSNIIHEQWMARNGSWAPEEQMVAYSQLSEGEKEKDRVIARDAIEVLTTFNRYHGAKFVL